MEHDWEHSLIKACLTSKIIQKVFEILEREHPEILARAITEVLENA